MERSEGALELRPALIAGGVAGLVALLLQMALVPLAFGGSPWVPARLAAALVMAPEVLALPDAATFQAAPVLAGVAVHLGLSLALGCVIAGLAHRAPASMVAVTGGGGALVLYWIQVLWLVKVFPWFASAHNWVALVSALTFGIGAATGYRALRRAGLTTASAARGPARAAGWPCPGSPS